MLVITRNTRADLSDRSEVVVELGDGRTLVVTVLRIGDRQVQLGFTAPPGVAIHRNEVHEQLTRGGYR